jgi:hypothetical protein
MFIEGHEGTSNVIQDIDGDLQKYLKDKVKLDLDRTFVFLVSDHGLHMGLGTFMNIVEIVYNLCTLLK